MAKYLKINGKVCLDTLRSMSRPFFQVVYQVPTLFLYCPDLLSDNMGKYENKRLVTTANFRIYPNRRIENRKRKKKERENMIKKIKKGS